MAKKRGYFILYRDIYSSPIFKNLLQASCWIYFISSASHRDTTLRFLGTDVFIKRGEAIMPLRVTAKRFGMTYSEMRQQSDSNLWERSVSRPEGTSSTDFSE